MEVTVTVERARGRGALAWALALALALQVASLGTARADAQQEARTSFELGVEASRAQRWEEARAQFSRSLQLLPKASTMFNLAIADIKLGLGREALEQLEAFQRAASPSEHAQMLERAEVLRPQAQALVDSQQATAEHGGNVLSKADDGFTDEVRSEIAHAREDYARGRDREALAGFERAYKKTRRAELLYNIGVVADRLREDRRAARAYDQFVAALPDAREAAVAQVRSDALHAVLAERERAGEEAVRHSASSSAGERDVSSDVQGPRAMLIAGAVVLTGSVALLGVSGGLLAKNGDSYDKCLDDATCTNQDAVRRDRAFMYTGAVIGGLGATTGLVLTIVGGLRYSHAKERQQAMARLPAIAVGPSGALLTWQGRF